MWSSTFLPPAFWENQKAGLVERSSDLGEGEEPSRRVFQITSRGDETLQEWFAGPVYPEHQWDEFIIKLIIIKLIIGVACGWADPSILSSQDRVRVLRHGVDQTGHPLLFMPAQYYRYYINADLGAIIAYIQSLPPVDKETPPGASSPLGESS